MRRSPILMCLAVAAAFAVPASAQDACPSGRVTRVFVDNHSIFDPQDIEDTSFRWAYELANTLHVRTRASFLRREILLAPGDCYDPFLVADSERILRRYAFIAQADVYGVRQEDGDWHLIVDTRDEWTTVVDVAPRFDEGFQIARAEIREENFLGRGMLLGAFYREFDAQRLQGVQLGTPRLFNSRTDGVIRFGSTRVGDFVHQELFHPFVGEVGRFGWRQLYWRRHDFFTYSAGTPSRPGHILLPVEDERFEATFAARIGDPGNLTVFGLGISRSDLAFPGFPEVVEQVVGNDFGNSIQAPPELSLALVPQTRYRAGTRVNLLLGQRNIRFVQRRGLDALRGLQDLEVGSEVALTIGRTVGVASSAGEPDDIYTRFRLYAGAAPARFAFLGNVAFEGRQVLAAGNEPTGWRDLMAEVDLLAYWQPTAASRHTFFGRLAAGGGWALDQPFQLTLGGPQGVRGFFDEDFPGARRVVISAEDRILLGWPFPDLFDLGATLFADMGRIWPGEVPYGVDSGWRATVGAGLRFGFPAESRGVIRVDAAFPFGPGSGLSDMVLRVSFGDLLGFTGGLEDFQMARSRRMTVGPDRFSPIWIRP